MYLLNYLSILICTFLLLSTTETNAQPKIEKLVKTFHYSSDWKVTFVADTSFFPLFKKKQVGKWKFVYLKNKSKEVSFTVFKFSVEETDFFAEKIDRYMMLSSCFNSRSENDALNFISFVKDDFLFLLDMCPCGTKVNKQCAQLAESIKTWTTE